jgi:hypothetical protein
MHGTLRVETTVLPGHRVEVSSPDLPEGAKVDVIVVLQQRSNTQHLSMLELLDSLPPGPRAFPDWEAYERHLRQEKDSWER